MVILRSFADSLGRQIADQLDGDYEVVAGATPSTQARFATLPEIIRGAAFVIVALPNPGDRGRSNVLFELGVAVGIGRPVLVVADPAHLPHSLQGMAVLHPDALPSLRFVVAELASRKPFEPPLSLPPSKRLARREDRADSRQLTSHAESLTADELIERLRDAFVAGGADVVIPNQERGKPVTEIPDLVLWADGLQGSLGLPLPIEVVRSAATPKKIRKRLARLMDRSGASSLLIVVAEPTRPSRWTDGSRQMLAVSADDLLEELANRSTAEAILVLAEEDILGD